MTASRPLPTAGVTTSFQAQSWDFKWTHDIKSSITPRRLQDALWEFSLALAISTFAIHHVPLSASQTCHHHRCFVITMTQTQGALFVSRSESLSATKVCNTQDFYGHTHRGIPTLKAVRTPRHAYNIILNWWKNGNTESNQSKLINPRMTHLQSTTRFMSELAASV